MLALSQCFAKGDYAWKLRNFASEASILQLIVTRQLHCCFDIGRERKRHHAKANLSGSIGKNPSHRNEVRTYFASDFTICA